VKGTRCDVSKVVHPEESGRLGLPRFRTHCGNNQMNSYGNARLTFEGRKSQIQRIAGVGLIPAAKAGGIGARTARKWHLRFEQLAVQCLMDHSSRPVRIRSTINEALGKRVYQLCRVRMPMRGIAAVAGRSVATFSRILRRLCFSSLSALDPAYLVLRYWRAVSGELRHTDTKRLWLIVRVGRRITGDRRDSFARAGWEFAPAAIDDQSRAGYLHSDERRGSAVKFLKSTGAHCVGLGVRIERLFYGNGSAHRFRSFNQTCLALGSRHTLTQPRKRLPNGKVERLVRTYLRECAYGLNWANSAERSHRLSAALTYFSVRTRIWHWATSLRLLGFAGTTYCNPAPSDLASASPRMDLSIIAASFLAPVPPSLLVYRYRPSHTDYLEWIAPPVAPLIWSALNQHLGFTRPVF
jgi:transposase InsO family protein